MNGVELRCDARPVRIHVTAHHTWVPFHEVSPRLRTVDIKYDDIRLRLQVPDHPWSAVKTPFGAAL